MQSAESQLGDALTENKWRGLWRLTRGQRLKYGLATASNGVAALARTGVYYLLAYFVDSVLSDDALFGRIPWIAVAFVGLAALQGGFTYVSGRLAADTAESIARRLRNYIYDHVQRLSFSYHDRMQTGELLQRSTSDVDALRRLFSEQLLGIGRISLLFLVNFVALLTLNVRLALMSVAAVPVILVVSIFFFKKLGVAFEANQEQEAKVSSRLQENLSGVRVVKAFARQKYESSRFDHENQEQVRRGIRLVFMHGSFWPVTDLISGGQMLFGYFLGATMAINGTITVGEYVAFVGFLNQIIWPLRHLGRLVAQMSTGLVSYGRIREVLSERREPLADGRLRPEGRLQGDVIFQQVDFRYQGPPPKENQLVPPPPAFGGNGNRPDDLVLADMTFRVPAGQTVALLGGTGSGKTSLVNLLPRFYDYTSGSIRLDDAELRDYARGFLRKQIGVVHQEPFLFSTTLRENITYGLDREVSDEEVEQAARAAAIHDVILTFPRGYDTLVGERGVTLSGGQKQRVTLARTLLQNPSILILDDATSSVDTETEAAIRGALLAQQARRTTFIIAHRVQSVMYADLILVMDQGRIIQRGTHDELIHQRGTYRQIYELQSQIEAELAAELDEADKRELAHA